MKIAILSRSPDSYSTRALKEAGLKHGHHVKVLDTLKFSISVEEGQPGLFFQGKRFSTYDGIIPRIGASITFYGTAVVRQFEQMGVFTLNSSQSIMTSRDKLCSMQILSRHRIGLPANAFVRNKQDVLPAIERVGGAPVIIKLLEGTQGIGVILADTGSVAAAIIETLQSTKQNVLIQKFVSESKGRDVRAFVVGDRVVAAMRRRAQGQEFRSNLHRGGTTEMVKLDPDYEQTAVRATQILGLHVAGVDMLEGDQGPQIMEVNSSPGLEGIQTATGIDIAGLIFEYMEQQVLFPEIDLRQRLTLESGYGVAEIMVSRKSHLVGKSIANCGLRDEDVLVLSIDHDHTVVPNPKGSRVISAGDRLLCFGKLSALKNQIPANKAGHCKVKK